MSSHLKPLLTTDEFLVRAQQQAGRWELQHGEAVTMSPERVGHANAKFAVQTALKNAIQNADARCYMLPDGMSVRIDASNAYEPDALVYCGKKASKDQIEITNPVIVVEVLTPSTRRYDTGAKFSGYMSVPGLRHFLIVETDKRLVIHHRQADNGTIESAILRTGVLKLDPPGVAVEIAAFFDQD